MKYKKNLKKLKFNNKTMNNKLAVVLTPHTLEELDINVEALIDRKSVV